MVSQIFTFYQLKLICKVVQCCEVGDQ